MTYVEKNVYSVSCFCYVAGEEDDSEFDIVGTFNTKDQAKKYLLTLANQYMHEQNNDCEEQYEIDHADDNGKEDKNSNGNDDKEITDVKSPYRVSKGEFLSTGERMVIHLDDIPKDDLPDSRYGTKYNYNTFIFRIHKSRLHKTK